VDSGDVAGDGGSVYNETAWTDHSGPAVVLTHDGLLHRETWDAQFTTFAHHYRVARWDRRGYGRSPAPHAPYSSVDDLARVVRSVSDAPATLIGCSFGSLVSLHCALDHPQLVRALVLVGPIVSGLGYSEHFLTRGGRRPPALDAPSIRADEDQLATQSEHPLPAARCRRRRGATAVRLWPARTSLWPVTSAAVVLAGVVWGRCEWPWRMLASTGQRHPSAAARPDRRLVPARLVGIQSGSAPGGTTHVWPGHRPAGKTRCADGAANSPG